MHARQIVIRKKNFFIRLEFYGIRGPRRERKKEARRIPVHYKDSVFFGINKVFGADSTEYGKKQGVSVDRTNGEEGKKRAAVRLHGRLRRRLLPAHQPYRKQ